MILPGLLMLQLIQRTLRPEQFLPPQDGVGLLHLLVNLSVPIPQVLLHDPRYHKLHPPLTVQRQ